METDELCRLLDAIALGVEAQFDPLMVYSRIIIQKTRSIAQEIGFHDSEIQLWEKSKYKQNYNGRRAIRKITLIKHEEIYQSEV